MTRRKPPIIYMEIFVNILGIVMIGTGIWWLVISIIPIFGSIFMIVIGLLYMLGGIAHYKQRKSREAQVQQEIK